MTTLLRSAVFLLATAAAHAQNDECAGALVAGFSGNSFDTTTATASPEAWTCGGGGGPDLWYTYTSFGGPLTVSTCGSSFDTVVEVFSGSCGSLVLEGCDDDSCEINGIVRLFSTNQGETYTIRVGGYAGASGTGTLWVGNVIVPPGTPESCLSTFFFGGVNGPAGGALYFDLDCVFATEIDTFGISYSGSSGTPVGLEVYTTTGSHVGVETDLAAWTLAAVDDGTAQLDDGPPPPYTFVRLAAPFVLPAGTTGIALVATGAGHEHAIGNGANQVHMSRDGNMTLTAGTATDVPFTGALQSPRVFNGLICPRAPGSGYCVAEPNSTGNFGRLFAQGSTAAAANDLTLYAYRMPANQFGLFVVSRTQDFIPGLMGASNGNLCIGGVIGRFQGPGQVLSTEAQGRFKLTVDLTAIPLGGAAVVVLPGDQLNFQAWHRDTVGVGSNLTEGLQVDFN